jgi:lipoprotein-anchoring transpeptidase ErfK/SrfK
VSGSLGEAVSHGWVRRFDEDVRHPFEQVEVGIPVTVLP